MTKKNLSVHGENILPIIKKWLYSDKDIFLRELVSNACDAIKKLKIFGAKENISLPSEERIDIEIDQKQNTLTISDTGIGMSMDEVEKYIAQIAFSGAEDFLKKYESSDAQDQMIGHFGLGFYSSYMVSKKVEIFTLSHKKKAKGVYWSCDGSSEYMIEEKEKKEPGTKIVLHIQEDEYLQDSKIEALLNQYCKYLPYPIYFKKDQINKKEPLWLKPPSECTEKEYLEFYRELYPMDPDPTFWVHLNIDFPFPLKGILYFPKMHKRFDWQKSSIKLFCNRVFVSDDCKDLLSDYLTVLRGAIDSADLPLNVSRSYLQRDRHLRQLGSHISKKIADRLLHLFRESRENFIEIWKGAEVIIKLGALQDEKFYEKVKPFLLWKTLNHEWVTLEEYTQKSSDPKIYYTALEGTNPFSEMLKEKNKDILLINSMIDPSFIQFLESKANFTFQRIDAELDQDMIDSSREKSLLDSEGRSESSKIASFIQSQLDQKDLEVEAKSLANDRVSAVLLMDEKTRRLKDYMTMTGNDMDLPSKKTLVINTNHKIVQKAYDLQNKNPELSKELALSIYDTAIGSQEMLDAAKYKDMLLKQSRLLEKLVEFLNI